eukprot:TRINITY_DN21779_c0_g1_i1.p2 TRINITY_DN21779_c0_g1~~TRINITY_DN21779_c0_g1_i1.p2  ORF type:complete len:174 (+),score=72.76 TRINITY_DN21779_c0_g1_i1:75-524(+)
MRAFLLCALLGYAAAQEFDADIEKHFSKHSSRSEVFAEAEEQGKPVMVLITQPWCGACKNLKRAVNSGSKVKKLLKDFVVVHAVGDSGKNWQDAGHGYVPQTYFFNTKGDSLDVDGPNAQYKHFFGDEDSLANAMKSAAKKMKSGSGEL